MEKILDIGKIFGNLQQVGENAFSRLLTCKNTVYHTSRHTKYGLTTVYVISKASGQQ